MTPIERAARAVQKAWDDGSDAACGLPPIEFSEAEAMHLARAVLQAIREPSDHMLSDGAFQVFRGERITEDDLDAAKRVWRAMTNAALSE